MYSYLLCITSCLITMMLDCEHIVVICYENRKVFFFNKYLSDIKNSKIMIHKVEYLLFLFKIAYNLKK